MRDVTGNLVKKQWPFLQHEASIHHMTHMLPYPVMCCWNGMTVIKADVFYSGIRFRSGDVSTCSASECSHLCVDMFALNYSNIIVDPMVLVAYDDYIYSSITSSNWFTETQEYRDQRTADSHDVVSAIQGNITQEFKDLIKTHEWLCCGIGKHSNKSFVL
jgi:hypothetical protein